MGSFSFCLRRLWCRSRSDVLRHFRSYWLRRSWCTCLCQGCRTNHAANSGQHKYVLHNFLSKLLGRGIVGRLLERVNVSTVTANQFLFNVGTTKRYLRLVQFQFDNYWQPIVEKLREAGSNELLDEFLKLGCLKCVSRFFCKKFLTTQF